MSDQTNRSDEQRSWEELSEQAEEIARLERALAQQFPNEAHSVTEIEEAPPANERLFSRRVLIGWAIAALLAVFVVRMVLPIVFTTVRESIVGSDREAAAPETPATPTSEAPKGHIKKIIR